MPLLTAAEEGNPSLATRDDDTAAGPLGAHGVVARLDQLEAAVDSLLARVEPSLIPARDAAELARRTDRLVRRTTALRMELTARAAEAGTVTGKHGREVTPERWAAGEFALPPSQAAREMRTAEKLRSAPRTREAFREGKLSAEQARQVAEAVDLAPNAEASLLETAESNPGELAGRCRDIRARHGGKEAAEARNARHHRQRRLVRSETEDLAAQVVMVMPAFTGARFDALLQPFVQRSVDRARAEDRREPPPAIVLDAMMDALEVANASLAGAPVTSGPAVESGTHPAAVRAARGPSFTKESGPAKAAREVEAGPDPGSPPSNRRSEGRGRNKRRKKGKGGRATTRWGGATPKVIVRVDHQVLARGHPLPGERLDVQVGGGKPVPMTMSQLHEVLHDDPMVAFVLHDGVEVQRVVHPTRAPTPLQRTALEALHDRCADVDCRAYGPLEIDHLQPWSEDGPTQLANLAPICGPTHDAKTHRGRNLYRIPGSSLVSSHRSALLDDGEAGSETETAASSSPLVTGEGSDIGATQNDRHPT